MTGVDAFSKLTNDAVSQALLSCCSSEHWVCAVAAGRPYSSLGDLLAESDAAVGSMTEADLLAALAGHPRIGDQSAGWSSQEQSEVRAAGDSALRALADGNAAYEQRFGHIYLACATGRSATELLAFLRERLDNDRETEWRVVAAELAKINQIRLRKLIGGAA